MTNNPDEQSEYDIVEDDDAPLKAKPKRKPKSQPSRVPWRWVIPAFMIGLGIAALLLFSVLIVGVAVPVSGVVQVVVTATPDPMMLPTPTPSPLTPSIDPSPAQGFGGHIEDVVWHDDQLYVAHSDPPQLFRFDGMQWIERITPFNFDNQDGDEYLALAIHPNGDALVALESKLTYDEQIGDLYASSYLNYWKFAPSPDGSIGGALMAHSDTNSANGNPALPYLDVDIVYSPDGSLLATGAGGATKGGGYIYVWDTNGVLNNTTSQPLEQLWASATGTVALAFTEDGRHLTAVIRGDEGGTSNCIDCGSVMVYDVSDPANSFPLWEVQDAPHFNLDAVKQANISENGRYLALPKMDENRIVSGIEIYELPGMRSLGFIPLGTGQASEIKDLDMSDDGGTVAFIHHQVIEQTETLKLYVSQWSMGGAGMSYNTHELASLDALYTADYFLHVAQMGNFVYYVHPLHGVLNRIDVNSGEHIQMMQL